MTGERAPSRPSRRKFLIGTAGLLAFAPYGCGTTAGTDSNDGGGAFPRDVRHELGSTEVEALPRRIVSATGLAELDSLLALGVKPLAAGRFPTGWNPWAEDEDEGLSGVEPLAVEPEVNIEEVAAQGPDLILGQTGRLSGDNFPKLSEIAPTVATSFEDWRLNVRQVADSLGRTEDGEKLVERSNEDVAAAGERLSRHRDLRVSVFTYFPGEPALLTDDSFCGDVMRQMGLKRPQSQTNQKAPEGYKPISEQSVDLVDGDVILGLDFADNAEALDDFERSELFRRLGGVEAGRYFRLTPDESLAMYFASVLTVPVVLRVIEEKLGTLNP